MKLAPDEMWYLWEQGNFVGNNRPLCRVVVTKQTLQLKNDLFRTELFGSSNYDWWEIPAVNIQTLTRNHRVGTDSATMTLTLSNSAPINTGEDLDQSYDGDTLSPTRRELREQGEPGKYTYRRGLSSDGSGRNPWGHEPTEFVDMLLPNRLIRTFEGYGTDGSHEPWEDSKQLLTGTWLIDKVNIDAKGGITVECRDLAKLLIEQRLYPPIIPLDNYPLEFRSDHEETKTVKGTIPVETSTPEIIGTNVAKHSTATIDSSLASWYGHNASAYGHTATHAFDGDESTYWISMRNSKPNEDWSFEWLDADTGGSPVNRIRFKPWKGNYVLYVCVKENGAWQGDARVPYNKNAEPAKPNTSDTNYVLRFNMPAGEDWFVIDLPRIYEADTVRLTFTNLQNFGKISGGDYRAGIREFEVMGYTPAGTTIVDEETSEEVTTFTAGNITDYTDIIKLFLAWSGFYWAQGEDDPLFLLEEWGSKGGRVWGDFFYSGAYPVDPHEIPSSYWDNKSVMDGINQIKEVLGFIGYVDATGGFVWRPPNIWSNGNYITGVGWVGDQSIPVVSENTLLIDYGVVVDDASLRSEIIVISADDPTLYGSYVPGWAQSEEQGLDDGDDINAGEGGPSTVEGQLGNFGADQVVTDLSLLAGQQRIMLVPDYPFGQGYEDEVQARAEIEKFAYLVALWIHWSYRKGKIRIPANPALDVDDQIRVYEAKTSETYIHYILGMNVVLDMRTGSYIADIDTHWLGNGPDASWHIFAEEMPDALRAWLCDQLILTGAICGDPDPNDGDGAWSLPPPPFVDPTPVEIPRLPEHLQVPFPRPPTVNPIDTDFEEPPSSSNPGSVNTCSNRFMFSFWGNHKQPSSRRKLRGHSSYGAWTIADNRAWPAFQLLADIYKDEGFDITSASGKVVRYVAGTTTWSNHSWGTAQDINYPFMPRGRSVYDLSTGLKQTMLRIAAKVENIRGWDVGTSSYVPVFYWGQNFGTPDPAHWQVCCKASDLTNGVFDLAKGYPTGPPFEVPF